MFRNRLSVMLSITNAANTSTAAVSIAVRAETLPLPRSRPAGKATPAWNTAQMLTSQKASVSDHPCTSSRVDSAAPYPYSNTLTPIMASQGSQTIHRRDRPISCSGDSPMRYTRPFESVTSRYDRSATGKVVSFDESEKEVLLGSSAGLSEFRAGDLVGCLRWSSQSRPAARAQRYLAPSTATGFSVVYGYATIPLRYRWSL